MVICAKCGKKINRFLNIKLFSKWHWIKEYENSNKKTYYCPECYRKVWICAKCGRSLASFEKIGYFTDKTGKNTYYCPECFEKEKKRIERKKEKVKQKKKQEKKKLRIKLMNDELISKFSEKYFQLCLSLNRLRRLHKLKRKRYTYLWSFSGCQRIIGDRPIICRK